MVIYQLLLILLIQNVAMASMSEAPLLGHEQAPLTLAIAKYNRHGDDPIIYCSAVPIAPRRLLTAAHCIVKYYGDNEFELVSELRRVVVVDGPGGQWGEVLGNSANQIYSIKSTDYHPSYRQTNYKFQYDIAVIELNESLPYKEYPQILKLEGRDLAEIKKSITRVIISGYGQRENPYNGDRLGRGQHFAVDFPMNLGAERFTMQIESKINELTITDQRGLRAHCKGDSGGGFFAQINGSLYLMGIATTGKNKRYFLENDSFIESFCGVSSKAILPGLLSWSFLKSELE